MKKICLIPSNLLPIPDVKGGAIETIITNIIKEQEKKNDIELTVVSIYDKNAYIESKKYSKTNFIYIKKDLIYCITSIIYKLCNKVFKTNFNTYNTMVLNKIKNIKFDYIFAEGGHYESYNRFLKYFKKEQLILHLHHYAISNKMIDNNFSKLVGVSQYIVDEFSKTSSIKENYVLKNAIDLERFDKTISEKEFIELRKKYNFKKTDFVIIFCGRLIKEKGILELINAVKSIDNFNIKLLIVGSINFANGGISEYTQKINEEISKCLDRIVLTGYINNSELYKYYNISNVMVIPSTCEEAAGLVCVEGMVSRKPIITTGTGGIKEYVGENAIFVKNDINLSSNLKEQILYLYKNPKAMETLINNAYNVSKEYGISSYYDNFIKLIKRMK